MSARVYIELMWAPKKTFFVQWPHQLKPSKREFYHFFPPLMIVL